MSLKKSITIRLILNEGTPFERIFYGEENSRVLEVEGVTLLELSAYNRCG